MSSLPHAKHQTFNMHHSEEKKTQMHERRRGYIHSIEYMLDGANAFTVLR